MILRQRVRSGYAGEDSYGYSRAVRVGNQVWVSGTTARGPALTGDAEAQFRDILTIVAQALTDAGACLDDVVRSTVYIRELARDEYAIARLHAQAFARALPASTIVQVTGLSPESALVELEVTAVTQA
ncbi:Rid family hydrolase [Jannaschia sp. M317]|uniref:Rid family hydrolase n=1 Tax=Jannaschia sp. M317 TaxID=2867011 RepID=UPI0021A83750|nr:Rid family hydrolase [Jannaschia sp. M317]UWQ18583.1 hypothetical protein K3551_04630 [Jannaschia sp. M317]